jgi:hypothetical protein
VQAAARAAALRLKLCPHMKQTAMRSGLPPRWAALSNCAAGRPSKITPWIQMIQLYAMSE